MEENFDPNVPDRTKGDFFCWLCLASATCEPMWDSHIAGRRHLKNMKKFPNGVPKRNFDEDSFERPAKYGRYENDAEWEHYPPREHEVIYYPKPKGYVPEIRRQVIDYGHRKSFSWVTSQPTSEIFDAISAKEKHKDPVDEIFVDRRFDIMKTSCDDESTRRQIDGILQSSNFSKSDKETSYNEFVKELDVLLQNSSDLSQKSDIFCKDKFKNHIDDLLLTKSGNIDSKHKGKGTLNGIDHRNYVRHKSSGEIKILDHSISKTKKTEGKDKKKYDRDSDKSASKTIFSMKKSSETDVSRLENVDPDELSPELLDDLLNSYLKPKADSSNAKESAEVLVKNSAKNDKEGDPDIIAQKLETLPTKSFFQIFLKKLVKVDLQDSDELKMLLEVISEAQTIVCKKLPPHLQAVMIAEMSRNDYKATPVSVQNPLHPQTSSVPSVLPIVPQSLSQSFVQSIIQPVSQSVAKSLSWPDTQSISHTHPKADQSYISYPVQGSYVNRKTWNSQGN